MVAFNTKMPPGRGGGVGDPLGLWVLKTKKIMKPGETRFGTLWGPLGVRWTIFEGSRWIHGHPFFACFFDSIFDSYFYGFLMDLRAGKEQYFIAFLSFWLLEQF